MGMLVGSASPAYAADTCWNNGYSWTATQLRVTVTWYGAHGRCSALNADRKAQGYNDRFGVDPKTSWFTQLNSNRYSPDGYLQQGTRKTHTAAV